ncbi:MAG: alpha/beta hydrolase [Clostridia bacterium]|nr:alpha/beta hydrolase [Clostridia bacterium]
MKSIKKKRKGLKIALITVAVIILVTVIGCAIYLGDYYRADMDAIDKMDFGGDFTVKEQDNGNLVYMPKNPEAGIIFYPGGKVEYTAYIPLMEACASRNIACVLVEMPFNLAVFDMDAAEGITEAYPEIDRWYMAGHSLGGSMASSYLEDNHSDYEGLILLGSYSTADISDTSLDVLSIYGSEDGVLNREKYKECMVNLPSDTEEYIIDGGCHAYFGAYGAQDGDGTPAVSNREQIVITADKISEFIGE